MGISRPSYELDVDTHLITTKAGQLTLAVVLADPDTPVNSSITCYDCAAEGDIATANKIISFVVNVNLNGFQGGGNITSPLWFATGLVVVVAGEGAVGYVGYDR